MEDKTHECPVCETRTLMFGGAFGVVKNGQTVAGGIQLQCCNNHRWRVYSGTVSRVREEDWPTLELAPHDSDKK